MKQFIQDYWCLILSGLFFIGSTVLTIYEMKRTPNENAFYHDDNTDTPRL